MLHALQVYVSARVRFGVACLVTVFAVAVGTGCGGGGDNASKVATPLQTYVGKVQGLDAYIGLISDQERVAGYASDGKAVSVWFARAELSDNKAKLASREGQDLGAVEFSGDTATGDVQLGPSSYPFEVTKATGKAGLFQVAGKKPNDDSFQAGWVVLPDGSSRGSLDTFISKSFKSQPAPALMASVAIPGFGSFVPSELTTDYLDALVAAPD